VAVLGANQAEHSGGLLDAEAYVEVVDPDDEPETVGDDGQVGVGRSERDAVQVDVVQAAQAQIQLGYRVGDQPVEIEALENQPDDRGEVVHVGVVVVQEGLGQHHAHAVAHL